jgi:hypothetical protein
MKRAMFVVALIAITASLIGCTKRSDQPLTGAYEPQPSAASQPPAVQTVEAASASAAQSKTAATQRQGNDTDNSDRARETQAEVEYAVNKEMLSLISSLSRPNSDGDATPKVALTRMIPSLRLPRLVCGERQSDLTLECKSGDWEFDFFPMRGRADAFTTLKVTFSGAGNKTFNGWADAFRDIYKTGFTEEDKSGADEKLLSWSSVQRTICIDGSQHCPRTFLMLDEKTGEHPEVSITLADGLAFAVEVTLMAQPEWKRLYTGGERSSVGEQEQTRPADSLEASIPHDAEMSKKANAEGLQLLKASNPDFEAAKRQFEEAVRSDASNVEALNNLGYVYQRLGDFRTSEAHILKVIQLDPNRRVAYGNLGYVQAKLAKSSEASHNFCEYIKRFNDVEQGKATLKRVMSDPDVNVQSAVNEAIAQCSAR